MADPETPDIPENPPRIAQDASGEPQAAGGLPDGHKRPTRFLSDATRCIGTVRSTGQRCVRAVVRGTRYCKYHGGKIPKGIGSPQFRNGSYSKYLPSGLLDDYEQAVADPHLLSLRQDIALLHARSMQLVSRLHTGESGSLWNEIKEAYLALRVAIRQQDLIQIEAIADLMGASITSGIKDEEIWEGLQATIQKKSELSSKEWRRLVDMHQILTVEEAMHLFGQLLLTIRENVSDQTALRAIAAKATELLKHNTGFVSQANDVMAEIEAEQKARSDE